MADTTALNEQEQALGKLKEKEISLDEGFRYSLLGRLQQDCDYYLRNSQIKHLWANDIKEHIQTMKDLYNSFTPSEKPEWISMQDIEKYEQEMVTPYEQWLERVNKNGIDLILVADEYKDERMCMTAVEQNGYALEYVNYPSNNLTSEDYKKICKTAIKQGPLALKYVKYKNILTPEDYKEICMSAVQKGGFTLKYIDNHYLSPEDYKEILITAMQNGAVLRQEDIQTTEIIKTAVNYDGYNLRYVRNQPIPYEDYKEICMLAIKQDPLALKYAYHELNECKLQLTPEDYNEISMAAVKQNGNAFQYVREQTPELCMEAVKRSGLMLRLVDNQTPEICIEAIKNNPKSISFVNDGLKNNEEIKKGIKERIFDTNELNVEEKKVLNKSAVIFNNLSDYTDELRQIGMYKELRDLYLSDPDNIEYLNEEIKRNKQFLYVANHKEAFGFNRHLEFQLENKSNQLPEYEINELNELKYKIELNNDQLVDEILNLNITDVKKLEKLTDTAEENLYRLEKFSGVNELLQMDQSEEISLPGRLKNYYISQNIINDLCDSPYNYVELSPEIQSSKEIQKFVLDTIDLETRYEYLDSIQKNLGLENRFIIPLKQRYLSYLEGFKDTPLYENATKEMLVTKEGRSFVHDRLNKINDFLDLTTNDQDFKDFSTYTTRLFTIENAIEQRNLDLEDLQFDKDALSNSLDDLSKQKPRFWQFNRKNELKKSILKTEHELHTTDKKIQDIKEDIKKLEVDKVDLKTTLSSDKYFKISESLHNIDDLKLVTSYSIISNLQKYQDYFVQDKETLESALAHNPYNQSLEMNIKINSSSITGIDKQLSDINEVLKQAESHPGKYDLQINFDIDDNRIIKNQCIDQSDIKKISSELASNSKTAILKLAKNMIKDQGDDQKERMDQIDNITNKLNEPVEEVIEMDVAIKPAIAF